MAELNYDSSFGADDTRPLTTQFINISGAVLSISLIAGLAFWGWQLLKRDVAGIPVVQALEGPMRMAPNDPGGKPAAYQGLQVMQIAAAGDDETTLPDEIKLAAGPQELSAEDVPAIVPVETKNEVTVAALENSPAPVTEPAPTAPSLSTSGDATDAAVAAALSGLSENTSGPTDRISGSIPGITASLRPRARPEMLTLASVTPTSGQTETPTPLETAAAVASGTRMVQLGAFTTSEEARTAWSDTNTRFAPYMNGKTPVIQKAETGGRSFFRLRAVGFEDLADARRFCSILVADGASCIPVIRQ